MDWLAGKVGTIYQKPAHAIGLSTPPIGCVLDLPGVPGGGNKIYDRSPYGNHGTITGATWKFQNGLWVLDFDGQDDYIEVPDSPCWEFGDKDWAIELWVNHNVVGGTYYASQYTATTNWWAVLLAGGTRLDYHSNQTIYQIGDWTPSANTWYLLTFVYTSSDGKLHGYVNETEIGSGVTIPTVPNPTDSLLIGQMGGAGYLNGQLSLYRIYKRRALSALEIQNHYQQEKHLFGV